MQSDVILSGSFENLLTNVSVTQVKVLNFLSDCVRQAPSKGVEIVYPSVSEDGQFKEQSFGEFLRALGYKDKGLQAIKSAMMVNRLLKLHDLVILHDDENNIHRFQ